MLRKLRAGEIDFFSLSGVILSNLVPAAAVTGVAFAFPNYDAVWSAVDGELGSYIRQDMRSEASENRRRDLQRNPAEGTHEPGPRVQPAGA